MQIWATIPNYPNYRASNWGKIRSIDRISCGRTVHGTLIAPISHNTGYQFVWLFHNGKRQKQYVHRLVLSTFVTNTEGKPSVNHKNGIKTDNRLFNLEWATWEEQSAHAYKNGLIKQKKNGDHARCKKIIQYDLNMNVIKVWVGARYCARQLNLSPMGIINAAKSKTHYAYGFKWKYAQ